MNQGQISDRLRAKAARSRVPYTGAFELTPLCNFSCKMCYIRRTAEEAAAAGGLRDTAWWLEIARQARDCGMLFPLITGGEPFTHPGIREICREIRLLGMLPSINTNGTLIGPAEIERIKRYPPVRFNITLYGASDQSYGALCGDYHGFSRVKEAVKLLHENGMLVHFNASITPENQDELRAIIEYGKSVGVPVRVATYMFPPIRRIEDSYGKNARLTPEDAGRLRVMADYWQLSTESFLRNARYYGKFQPVEELDLSQPGPGVEMRCTAGRCSCWIDWQGGLMPCGMNSEPRISLDEHSFSQAWELAKAETEKAVVCHTCHICPNYERCHICGTIVHHETGTYGGRPEYYCRMMQAAAEQYRVMSKDMGKELLEIPEGPVSKFGCEI